MSKILFTATVDSHILNFHLPFLKWFKEQGFETHVASNGDSSMPYVDKKFDISFSRNPLSLKNLKAFKQLHEVIQNNQYEMIHCHTPIAGVITRVIGKRKRRFGTKILYTAHGFHFYKGAPLLNWLVYYPIEKLLSRFTDCIITMNEEDYGIAKRKFKMNDLRLVNGVGVNLNLYTPPGELEISSLRKMYKYSINDFIIINIGELIQRKNQSLLINVASKLRHSIPELKIIIAGAGSLLGEYQKLVNNLDLQNIISFIGYRQDIDNLLKISNIAVSTAKQEGLPVNVMEAMATGLPIVVTNCRGNRDLITDGKNGFVVDILDENQFGKRIVDIYKSKELQESFKKNSLKSISNYSLENILLEMKKIYLTYL